MEEDTTKPDTTEVDSEVQSDDSTNRFEHSQSITLDCKSGYHSFQVKELVGNMVSLVCPFCGESKKTEVDLKMDVPIGVPEKSETVASAPRRIDDTPQWAEGVKKLYEIHKENDEFWKSVRG